MLYSRDWHNIVTKLYFNKKIKNIYNEATEISFSTWIDKCDTSRSQNTISVLKINELPSHEKTRRNQCISLSERSQTQKSTNSTIPTMQYARKCRTMKTAKKKKISGFQRLGVGERMNRETIEDFSRAVRYYDDGYICPNPQNTQKQE